MFNVDLTDVKKMETDLRFFKESAYPFATRNTINTAAFETQKVARTLVGHTMILRSKYVNSTIQVQRAKTLVVRDQAAHVGSTFFGMADQEFGATQRMSGKVGKPLATGYSAGQEGQPVRTKLPTRANRLRNIKLSSRSKKKFASRRQENAVKIKEAIRNKKKTVYLDTGNRQGIFRLTGRKRLNKARQRPGMRVRLLHDLTHPTVRIPKNTWLGPSVRLVTKQLPHIHAKSLKFQMDRHKIFT